MLVLDTLHLRLLQFRVHVLDRTPSAHSMPAACQLRDLGAQRPHLGVQTPRRSHNVHEQAVPLLRGKRKQQILCKLSSMYPSKAFTSKAKMVNQRLRCYKAHTDLDFPREDVALPTRTLKLRPACVQIVLQCGNASL